jgi:nitrate reductase gamma subunit
MRTSWTISGLALAVIGAVVLAAAVGAMGHFYLPVHALLGEIGGTLLAIGGLILFFERRDNRR